MKLNHHYVLTFIGILIPIVYGTGIGSADPNNENQNVSSNGFNTALEYVLKEEGGYVNDPADVGGETNFGITQTTFNAWLQSTDRDSKSVRDISREEVEAVYKWFWDQGNCYQYQSPVDVACLDSVINFGVEGGKSFFDNLPDSPQEALKAIANRRLTYRNQRVNERPDQARFLEGWKNRDRRLLELAK